MTSNIAAVGGGWSGAGLQGRGVTTAKELCAQVGLNFTVEGRSVYDGAGNKLPGFQAITRADTGHVYQVARDTYGILQPGDMFAAMDSIVGTGAAHYTSAGTLNGSAVIFACAVLPDEIKIGTSGDSIKPYLAGFNSFDGSYSARIKALSFRPICQNTALAALRTERDTEIAIKHSLNVKARMMVAAEALKAANFTFAKLGETYRALARLRFTDRDMTALAATLVPTKEKENGDIPAQAATARESLLVLFEQGKGQAEFSDIRGTGWAAFNAVTEYVDHLRPTRVRAAGSEDESRLSSAWLGSGDAMKRQAFELLTARL